MKIYLPKQTPSGYTIIEIIISLFIIIILFSVVQANYRQFILAKSLDSVVSQIISDIKLTQEYALAGKKPPLCTGLNGYIYATDVTNNKYVISADCETDITIKEIYLSKIAKGISFSGSNSSVLFKILGGGTDITAGGNVTLTVTQQTTGNTRVVVITSGGEVK